MEPELVFLVEEPSAETVISALIDRILPGLIGRGWVKFLVFNGKPDLERKLVPRLRGYRNPNARFIILMDQDARPDCRQVKASLRQKCVEAERPDATVRIVCQALEAWYLADLEAAEAGMGVRGLAHKNRKKKFASPDGLPHPDREFQALVKGAMNKGEWAAKIAPHLDLDNTRSPSFAAVVATIRQALPHLDTPTPC